MAPVSETINGKLSRLSWLDRGFLGLDLALLSNCAVIGRELRFALAINAIKCKVGITGVEARILNQVVVKWKARLVKLTRILR